MAARELHLVSHVTTILDLSSFSLDRRVFFFLSFFLLEHLIILSPVIS